MPLNMRLVSAGKITDSLGREWDPIEHPRGRDGRFIRVFKLIHMFLNSQDSSPWGTAQVTQINPNGSVRAKVTAVADPKWNDRVGHEVDLLPGSIESLNEKASLAKAKDAVGGATAAIDKYDFSPEKMHDFYVASGFNADSPTGDMSIDVKALADFKQHGIKLHGRTKYHLALYAKSISGGNNGEGPAHTDDDFMDLLEEFDVDPKIIDDTPDGMSGLKVLADGVNETRSPNYNDLDNIAHFDETPPLAPGTIREARLRHSDVYVRWYADGKQSVVWPDGTEKQHDKNKGSLLLAAQEAHKTEGVAPEGTPVAQMPNYNPLDDPMSKESLQKVLDDEEANKPQPLEVLKPPDEIFFIPQDQQLSPEKPGKPLDQMTPEEKQAWLDDIKNALDTPNGEVYKGGTTEDNKPKFEVLDDPGKSGDGYYNAPGAKLWGKYGAAGVMIRHKDENGVERFLMVQRGPIVSSNKGKWQLPGGALNSNENDYQGTARELVEELAPPDGYLNGLTPVGEVKLNHPSGWHYNNITADSPEQFEPKVDGTETGDAGWFTKEEIANLPLHPALADNLDNIFNTFNNEIDVPDANAPEVASPEEKTYAVGEKIDAIGWTQTGGQGGSNTGGVFTDENGNTWYVKNQKSETHAKNEALAAALYEEAGINSAPQILANTTWGPNGTASPWIENTKDFASKRNDPAYRKKVQEGFAFDAWIANWDTMGLVWDNIVTDKDGNPLRVDPGGALYFRAQGKPKGAFGDEVNELFTFKDQSNNAGKVFHDIDQATELASAQKVIDISPEKIDELVDAMNFPSDGPFDGEFMKKTLKARRVFIADHYGIPLPENEATPDPIPEDITDADLPSGFTPIESNGPAIDYIDKHSIYFFDEDTQNDIADLGGYHAENAYGKLVAYFEDVQNGDSEFNSEIVDKHLDNIIAGLEVDYDNMSEVKLAAWHVKKLVAMRDDLIPFENKQPDPTTEPDAPSTPEPDAQLNLPGPESTDWVNMVDDQGPYRWGFGGKKLRVGDQVISKNDGITGVIHSFEKNHKGIVVKTPDGKKKARKNDSLALASEPSTPEPTPTPSAPTLTTHNEDESASFETQLLAWWDVAKDGDKFAFNSADGLTYTFELDSKNNQMHFKDPGGNTIESWFAHPDKGIDMDKLVDAAYLLQHPPTPSKPTQNRGEESYDDLHQSIKDNTDELSYFNDVYSYDNGGYVGTIVSDTMQAFDNGDISSQQAADAISSLYNEFAQKNANGDDNGLSESAIESLYDLANDYYAIEKVTPESDTQSNEIYTGIAPLFDDDLGEFLSKNGKYSPEQNGKTLQQLLDEDISELNDGSLSQSDFMDGLHTYADQLHESGQTKLANELMSVIKSAPTSEPDSSPDGIVVPDINIIDETLSDDLINYVEDFGHSIYMEPDVPMSDEINGYIEELNNGDITPEELGQKLESLAGQIDEPWNPGPGEKLHELAAKFPQPGSGDSGSKNDLDTSLENFIADIPTGDIFDKQEYDLPGGYKLDITEPDEDGDGHIMLKDANGDNLESWTYGWAAYSPNLLKEEIQNVIKQEEDDKKPVDPANDPWNPLPTNSADPNGHSAASAPIEHLIDDWVTGDIFDGKNINLPYGLSFRFSDDDSDPLTYNGPVFQVVDSYGEVIDEWPTAYAEKNVEGMRTYVESILDQAKAKNDSNGVFSPPADPAEKLGEGDFMEWMIGEDNEKLDNIIAEIENNTGVEFNADAGDIYDVLVGNQDPNKYPQYAIAAISVADHLDNAGALDPGDMNKLYDALGIPESFYSGKEPYQIIQAIKSDKGFGNGDNENVGTLGPIEDVDIELAEWEKSLLWSAPTHVDGAHQPDSMDAAKAFLNGDNPPVGAQLIFTGYNWTLSYELDGADKPVYVLRDSDSSIHGAWDPSDVTPSTIDGIVSDVWTKMHANDVYDDGSSTDLPYSTLDDGDPTSAGVVVSNATPEDVAAAVDQFVKNVHGKIVFSGDYLSLPDGYKLKFVLDSGVPKYQLFDGDDSFIDEWDFDQDDLVSDMSLSIQEEIPSLGLSSGKKTPVGNAKIDYNGNSYDTPPPGFKVHAVSTTSQDVVLVEHPAGGLWLYHAGGGHDYAAPKSSLPSMLQNTSAWKPFADGESAPAAPAAPTAKPEDIAEFVYEIPNTIYGVKTLFPGMTDYQAKQYRNAHYALTDVKYDTPFSKEWQDHLNKAKYNLEHAGPDAQPMLEKLKKWELDVNGWGNTGDNTVDTLEAPTSGFDLGPGFAKIPPGHTPKFMYKDGSYAYAVEGPDGGLEYYYKTGEVISVTTSVDKLAADPEWHPYAPANSSSVSDEVNLGPGFAKPPAGSKPLYVYSNYGGDDDKVYLVEHPDGQWKYYYPDGDTLTANSSLQYFENDPEWLPYQADSVDETDHGDPAPGDISVAVGSTVSKFYGHDYTKQADGTWTSPTNSIVIDADSPAAEALNDHVKNPGLPVPKGDPGTTGEYRVDANGNVMRIGDTVQSTTDGLTGYISKFENNDKGVVVVGPDGKPRARHRLKLKNVDPNAAPPKKPEVMPSAKSSDSPDAPSVSWTPPVATAEVDPTSPWFEKPKPTAPTPPADLGVQYVSDAWMAQADANYKKRMKAKNANWTEKDLSQSSTYSQFKNVQENGSISELDKLLSQGRITPEMHADAKAQIQKNEIPVKKAQADYDAALQQYSQDVLAWNKANGVVWGVFPGAPAPATEPFTGGKADWTKAPLGTPAAKSVMEAMSAADTALAVRGSSFSFDSDQVEDLDVRVMRVLDVDGTEKLEMKFKLTAWAGDDLRNKLDTDPKVKTSSGIALLDRKIDSKTGLPQYLSSTKYSSHGTTWTYTDPETGARVEVTRDGSSTTGVHATTLHNQVRVFMPAGSTAEDFQKTMENLGIKKSTPATEADMKAYAENKLISVFGGHTDPTKNLTMPAARSAKLGEIEQKYGVTLADLRLGTNGKGRTKLFLSDAARDKMIAYANVKGFKHNFAHGNDINRWKSVLAGENNGLLSTHSRWSEGISGSGMSSSSDMGSGAGGDFIYTRVMHTHDNHAKSGSYIVLHPKAMMRRTDVYSNSSDNGTGKHYDNQKAYDIMQGNPYEVVWKHGIPINEMYYVVVGSTTMRSELIQYLHSRGITHINGIPVEEFVLTSGMPVPVVDESQWSTADLPPAVGAVPGATP